MAVQPWRLLTLLAEGRDFSPEARSSGTGGRSASRTPARARSAFAFEPRLARSSILCFIVCTPHLRYLPKESQISVLWLYGYDQRGDER